ncbi:hypothetical protein AB0L53_46505 [Nonomuraea sp. NPDC052129]
MLPFSGVAHVGVLPATGNAG